MRKLLFLIILPLVIIVPVSDIWGIEDQDLKKQRREAQKNRQTAKKERNRKINDSTQTFKEFVKTLKDEYKPALKDLDTEFELKEVELQAEKDAKITIAEAEYQKKWSSLFLSPEGKMTADILKTIETEGKAYSDDLFRIKKAAAMTLHKERMANLLKKHKLLNERDQRAMREADALGLTKDIQPILAKPIGETLTRQEEQWNQREKKEVTRLEERNIRTLKNIRNGEPLREWERKNLEEDFKLKWDEKEALHNLNHAQTYYTTLLAQATQGAEVNQQDILAKFAEINKENQLVKIKYKKIRQQNNITRREEKKKILSQ